MWKESSNYEHQERQGSSERRFVGIESLLILSLRLHQSVTVMIADACPTCVNGNSIDLSMVAFQAIAPLADGIVPSKLILP
jgi:hypothetical protein